MEDDKKTLAQRIAEIKPTIAIDTTVDSYGSIDDDSDSDYKKLRHARCKKAVKVLEEEINGFNVEDVAARVLKSLKAELAIKRAEVLKEEAEMDAADISYDGAASGGEKDDSSEKSAKGAKGEGDEKE